MSLFAAYWFDEPRKPEEGEHLATTKGWDLFSQAIEKNPTEYPKADHLVQEGWLAAQDLPALEEELEAFLKEPPANLKQVGERLLRALERRPGDCLGMMVTDGEPG